MDKHNHKNESDIAAVVDLLENDWTNPFDKDPSESQLAQLSHLKFLMTSYMRCRKERKLTKYSRRSAYKKVRASMTPLRR